MSIKLTLPLPPSANRYWRMYNNRMVVSPEATAYKEQVGWLCREAGLEPLSGSVCLTVRVYRKQKSGDLDNKLKVIGDALNGYAWFDDAQVVEIHAYRYDDKHNPRVEIECEVMQS